MHTIIYSLKSLSLISARVKYLLTIYSCDNIQTLHKNKQKIIKFLLINATEIFTSDTLCHVIHWLIKLHSLLDQRCSDKMLKFNIFLLLLWFSNVSCAKDWWENGNFYQIYPRSFQDSNGDGIGDLNGITSRLPYLKQLGVSGIWLSPIFKSPMADFGYDISDYRQVHAEYGTLDDLKRLASEARKLDIKLILGEWN